MRQLGGAWRVPRSVRVAVIAIVAYVMFAFALPATPQRPNTLPACTPNGPFACSTIDGHLVGTLIQECPCGFAESIARAGLDARDGGHAAIIHSAMYDLDMARVCGPVLCALSGGYSIVVFALADGSHDAIGISCPGVAACRADP